MFSKIAAAGPAADQKREESIDTRPDTPATSRPSRGTDARLAGLPRLNIAKTTRLSPPLWPVNAERTTRRMPTMTLADATRRLDQAYQGAPDSAKREGVLTQARQYEEPSTCLSPRVQLGVEVGLKRDVSSIPRDVLERSIYGAAKADFPYDRSEEVRVNRDRNGYPRHTFQKDEEFAFEILGGHLHAGDVRPGDRIVDLGSGPGHYARAADDFGLNITAVDMAVDRTVFEGTVKSTISAFAAAHRNCFTVAVSNHFSPSSFGADEAEIVAQLHRYASDAAHVLTDDGRFLCGISTKDPEYVSKEHPLRMEPILSRYFGKVDVSWASEYREEFGKYGSLGGMMAVIKCREPRPAPIPEGTV